MRGWGRARTAPAARLAYADPQRTHRTQHAHAHTQAHTQIHAHTHTTQIGHKHTHTLCRFLFDGTILNAAQTPEELGMDDGDIVEVFITQLGGR